MIKLIVVIMCLSLIGCETKEDIINDIDKLRGTRYLLTQEVNSYSQKKDTLESKLSVLKNELYEMGLYKDGKTPRHVLTIRLKQSHFTLDIDEHIKDEMNAIEFEIPVDKEFYNAVSVDSKLVDDFRVGSFVMNGSLGNWDMLVIGKRIE